MGWHHTGMAVPMPAARSASREASVLALASSSARHAAAGPSNVMMHTQDGGDRRRDVAFGGGTDVRERAHMPRMQRSRPRDAKDASKRSPTSSKKFEFRAGGGRRKDEESSKKAFWPAGSLPPGEQALRHARSMRCCCAAARRPRMRCADTARLSGGGHLVTACGSSLTCSQLFFIASQSESSHLISAPSLHTYISSSTT